MRRHEGEQGKVGWSYPMRKIRQRIFNMKFMSFSISFSLWGNSCENQGGPLQSGEQLDTFSVMLKS